MVNTTREWIVRISGLSAGQIDRVALWTFALVLVTAFLWLVAKKQLGGINKTTKADFIKRFTNEFFSEPTRDLIMLFDFNALLFRNHGVEYGEDMEQKPFPYFVINEDLISQFKIDPERLQSILNRKYYTAFEIDDHLLGRFEDVGSFEKDGLIDIERVYCVFGWYIESMWKNREIQEYIASQKETENEYIYEDFKYIYEKCNSFHKARSSGQWIWWWKLRWQLLKRFGQ